MNDEPDDELLRPPDPRMIPRWQPAQPAQPVQAPPPATADDVTFLRPGQDSPGAWSRQTAGDAPDTGPDDIVIRPFLLTGGRTRPSETGLRVETLVQASAQVSTANLRFEGRRIVELCRKPTSIAEIAASMRVPIGVARVLVSDLLADGGVTLLQREELSIQLIERIRDRVRAL